MKDGPCGSHPDGLTGSVLLKLLHCAADLHEWRLDEKILGIHAGLYLVHGRADSSILFGHYIHRAASALVRTADGQAP